MYEHPYLTTKVNEYEQQRLERDAELRRFIAEHPDQIVRRPDGAFIRMLRGLTARGARAPRAAAAADRTPADAGQRGVPACCEPATAR